MNILIALFNKQKIIKIKNKINLDKFKTYLSLLIVAYFFCGTFLAKLVFAEEYRYFEPKVLDGFNSYFMFGKYYSVNLSGVLPIVVPSNTAKVQIGFAFVRHPGDPKEHNTNKIHMGADVIDDAENPPSIHAMADGIVHAVYTGYSNGFGNSVIIKHPELGRWRKNVNRHGDLYSLYLHMRDVPLVKRYDEVKQGQQIGIMGETGFANDFRHLHFEIRYFSGRTAPGYNNIYLPKYVENTLFIQENYEDPHKFYLSNPHEGSFPFGWDMGRPDFYYLCAKKLNDKRIIKGYSDRSFGAENSVTRAQFLKMTINSMQTCEHTIDINIPKEILDQNAWYADFIQDAFNCLNKNTNESIAFWSIDDLNLTNEFWKQYITREEAAHVLINALGLKFAEQDEITERFFDMPKSREWDKWIYASVREGIFKGFVNNNGYYEFQPSKPVSRAEAVKVVYTSFFDDCDSSQ
jgi:murein DD-endopeptidase MepM/ murein hydrolase activator NlpD